MFNGEDGVFYSHATLRIFGNGMNPKDITNIINITPTIADVNKGFGMFSYTTRDIMDELLPLEKHITHIIDILLPSKKVLHEIQIHYETDILCMFGSDSNIGGFNLSPEVLNKLADLKLRFRTDEYFCVCENFLYKI